MSTTTTTTTTTKRTSRPSRTSRTRLLVLPILAVALLSACSLDSGSASLAGVKAIVVADICAGKPARQSSVAPLIRRAPDAARSEAAASWGVDLSRWLSGQSALGTSPACKAGKPGKAGQTGQSGQTGSAKAR